MDSSLEPLICRICLDEDEGSSLIAPCSCRGSQRWVHRGCLDKWRATQETKPFTTCSRCTECLTSYQLIYITNDNFFDDVCRFVMRDLLLAILGTQLIICYCTFQIFIFDYFDNFGLAKAYHMESALWLFYYLVSVAYVLSLLGFVHLIVCLFTLLEYICI
ncbi:hypothetical protein EON65_51140 [archaeon]|nr:MAG: hypothetical protein EON65_51140 [archaeon]